MGKKSFRSSGSCPLPRFLLIKAEKGNGVKWPEKTTGDRVGPGDSNRSAVKKSRGRTLGGQGRRVASLSGA